MAAKRVNRVILPLCWAALGPDGASPTDRELLEQYVACWDEAAFVGLLRRHGPMVLGVCRRVLRNQADAEDAFQATFLVLVRKADAIRSANVGSWLYGVAHNTALKALAMNRKRRTKEREAGSEGGEIVHWHRCPQLKQSSYSASKQARDAASRSGMEQGMAAGYNRLEEVLSQIPARS